MGISLGDVVEEESRIYGDGVNIAARLQALAEGGGICISGMVHDAVKGKLGFEYEDLGEQTLKNIAEPVRVYRLLSHPGAAAHRVKEAKRALRRKWVMDRPRRRGHPRHCRWAPLALCPSSRSVPPRSPPSRRWPFPCRTTLHRRASLREPQRG